MRFITDYGQSHIVAQIGGKAVVLRQTVHQMQRFAALVDGGKNKPEPLANEPLADRFARLYSEQLDLVEIVLNPEPNKIDWTREAIEKALDVKHIKILGDVWTKMVFDPKLAADPRLAPVEPGAN